MTAQEQTISEISTHFPTIQLKYAVRRKTEKVEGEVAGSNKISLEMVESWMGKLSDPDLNPDLSTGLVKFSEGDVLFSKLRPYLAKAFCPTWEGVASPEFLVLEPNRIDAHYLLYVLLSEETIDKIDASTYGAKMPRASWDFIGGLRIPCPDRETQKQISDFLDQQTSQIDALIEKYERLSSQLEDRRRALIEQGVTTGVGNNCSMKETGIDWFGEIPQNWDITRLRWFARVVNGTTPSKNVDRYWEGGSVAWLASTVLNDEMVTEPSELITGEALEECGLEIIPAGSVLIGLVGQGRTRGMSALLGIDATINQNTAAVIPRENLDGKYLYYVFQHLYEPLRELGRGANQPALNCNTVSSFQIPVPSQSEQKAIVDWLDRVTSDIHTARNRIEDSISLLKERRKALITGAVTGQIDLTERSGGDSYIE